jgi:hypothetical protein
VKHVEIPTVLISLLTAATVVVAQAEVVSKTDLGALVGDLVRQLNDERLDQREAAEKELVELGPPALPHLPAMRRDMSPEVKARLERVRIRLERTSSEAATRAAIVTMKGEMSLSKALAELERQTGNRLVDFRSRLGQVQTDPEVSLDFENADYWTVVDELLDKADLTLYSYSGPNSLGIASREEGQLAAKDRASHKGLFRFEATRIQAIRDLKNPANQVLRLTMEVTWEPRMSPIALTQPLDSLTALDEEGGTITPESNRGALEAAVQTTVGAIEMDIPLMLPDRRIRRIASLRGTMQALLPGRAAEFRFEDIQDAQDLEQRKAGSAVVLETVRRNGAVYDVRIRVRFDDASGALESHRGWIYSNEAYLIGPDGTRVDHAGFETTSQQFNNEIGVSYKFPLADGPDGYALVYKSPASIVKLPVEYELKDIELP